MKRATSLLAALTLFLGAVGQAVAGPTTIELGTGGRAADWLITGAGATGSAAYQVDIEGASEISLTKNASESGKFVKGGSLSNFNGFWYATDSFTLPSNATNVTLKFSDLFADDRVVLQLNGKNIGNATLHGNNGKGVMSFPGPGDTNVPPTETSFKFTNTTSGTITLSSDFVLGGVNTLTLVVNNTYSSDLSTHTRTFQNDTDVTEASLDAHVTYDLKAVPEPTGLCLAAVSLSSLGVGAWRRWRNRRRAIA